MRTTGAYEELQRRCLAILRDVGVERSLPFDAVCARVEELRGRRLVLRELPEEAAQSGVCGLWLGTDTADYIFYEARTAPLHREHIVLHEIGHVLCDHRRDIAAGAGDLAGPPDGELQPQLVKRLMARSSYTTREEQEAEMIASLIQSSGKPSRLAGPLGRLGAFLGLTVTGGE
ncbi:ImmA/IrrE family metallo-endopeptidase [Streptomyces sp. NBC_00083]|uniref:ImmA/IrrE family metallo-endopeptidase n=1 Tax=Streptomyces sp. NBC_00083 TaxID=2975647 RepID=UPI0022521904|nr:ImmA/IrrE family metallo-endopeptidase [Streptomyces sp. NBC_00083]MCX5386238.1 ImmA/IrrE family metallo-endopeptidase [Streptomyces sp. NBC_00083]